MTIMAQITDPTYTGFTVVRLPDRGKVFYSSNARDTSEILRTFYRIYRTADTRTLAIEVVTDANEDERSFVDELVKRGMVGRFLQRWERDLGLWHLPGSNTFYRAGGWIVEDPLLDLELELMLDSGSDLFTISAIETIAA